MNQGLSFDVDGLERNLNKLQNMSRGKSPNDHKSNWLNSLNPIKKINMGPTINFDDIARKMTEQQNCKYSAGYSTLETTDGIFRPKDYPSTNFALQPAGLFFNDFSKKHTNQISEKNTEIKRNILEEISSFDKSIEDDVDNMSNASDDEKNYHTLKNMLTDMKDFIGDYSRNCSTQISDDYDNTSVSMFMPKNKYDDMIDDDFSMKGFKPVYSGIETSDMLDKGLGQCYDTFKFF